MAITTSIPSTFLTPGAPVEFDTTTGSRGLVAITRRVALIGVKLSTGTAVTAVPYQIFTEGAADAYFGQGSELALMCRAALKAARKAGQSPEIWAVGMAESAGVKTTKTFTVTGPATASGEVVIRIAGRTIHCPVVNGDSANTVAASINTAIGAYAATGDLPGTAGVSSAVVTFTVAQKGINGEDLVVSVVSVPTGVAVTSAAGVTGTLASDIQASLDVLVDKHYHAIAIANHVSGDITELLSHTAARSNPGVKKWTFGFLAVTSTLSTATTLATAANSEYVCITVMEACPNMPGEIAAQMAVTRMAQEDPSRTLSGTELDLYACPAASVFTAGSGGEVESALAGGVTPLSVTDNGRVYMVRLITTRTTVNSAPYTLLRDFGSPNTLVYMGIQADATVTLFMAEEENKKPDLQTMARMRSALIAMARVAEKKKYIQNVEAHKAEFIVEQDANVPTRVNYSIPVSVVPGLEQAPGKLVLFVESAAA